MSDQHQKKDAGKEPLELLSTLAMKGRARVLDFGRKKYSPDGWREGMEWRRLIGAAMRHLAAFAEGEDIDPESGLPHIDHAGCCIDFLSEYQKTSNGTDDRYKGSESPQESTEGSDTPDGTPEDPWKALRGLPMRPYPNYDQVFRPTPPVPTGGYPWYNPVLPFQPTLISSQKMLDTIAPKDDRVLDNALKTQLGLNVAVSKLIPENTAYIFNPVAGTSAPIVRSVMKSVRQWEKEYGVEVMDPDGWRRPVTSRSKDGTRTPYPAKLYWPNDMMDEDEFYARYTRSTCRTLPAKALNFITGRDPGDECDTVKGEPWESTDR